MKQHIEIIPVATMVPKEMKIGPELLEEHIIPQVASALKHLGKHESFTLSGISATGLRLSILNVAKVAGRKVRVAETAHPNGYGDRQETIRVWMLDDVKPSDGGVVPVKKSTGGRKLSFADWDDGPLGEAARTADVEGGATQEPEYDVELSMDKHYEAYLESK